MFWSCWRKKRSRRDRKSRRQVVQRTSCAFHVFSAVPVTVVYIYNCSSVIIHFLWGSLIVRNRVIRYTISDIPCFFSGKVAAFHRKHLLVHSQLDLSVTVTFSEVSFPVPPKFPFSSGFRKKALGRIYCRITNQRWYSYCVYNWGTLCYLNMNKCIGPT